MASQGKGYSFDQIQAYYDRIALPDAQRHSPSTIAESILPDPAATLSFLSLLQRSSLTAIPFENLALHYASTPEISTVASDVFAKIVLRKRGGYCMENTALLFNVLLGLGFSVYATGGRVFKGVQPIAGDPLWVGEHWNHMVLIVNVGDDSYLVDVGFSNMAPVRPMRLVDGEEMRNSGVSRARLAKPGHSKVQHRGPKLVGLWEYQIKFADTDDWIPAYAFGETEFTPADFVVMSFYTSCAKDSWFTKDVVCAIMVEEGGEMVGDITLFREECKKRVNGKSELVALCATEDERVKLVRKEFGIVLTEDEASSIRGRISEIKSV